MPRATPFFIYNICGHNTLHYISRFFPSKKICYICYSKRRRFFKCSICANKICRYCVKNMKIHGLKKCPWCRSEI